MNPYQSPKSDPSETSASKLLRSHSPFEPAFAMLVWGTGTFFFSILTIFDLLSGTKLPGNVIYLALLLGPIVGVLGAIANKYDSRIKTFLIIATFCLLPIQFIFTGIVLLATTGFDGIH